MTDLTPENFEAQPTAQGMSDLGVEDLLKSLEEIKRSAASITGTLERDVLYSNHVLASVGSLLNDGLILLDKNKRIKVLNTAAADMLNVDLTSVLNRSVDDVIPHLAEALDTSKSEVKVDRENEDHSLVDISVSEFLIEQEETQYLIVARDLTDKRKQAYKILDLATFHSMLLQSIPVPTFYSDIRGEHLCGSTSFYELFGLTKQTAFDTSIKAILPHECGSHFEGNDLLKEEEFPFVYQGGYYILHKALVKNSTNEALGIICSVTENHCRNLTEESYEFLQVFLNYFNRNDKAICIVQLSDDTVVLANESYASLIGLDMAKIADVTFEEQAGVKLLSIPGLTTDLEEGNSLCLEIGLSRRTTVKVIGITAGPNKALSYAMLTSA